MNTSSNELIEQALAYGKACNKNAARLKLSQVVSQEPENARAWYLLSQVVDKKEQAVYCLEKVLKLQPGNQQAIERLASLAKSSNAQGIKKIQQKASNPRKKSVSLALIISLIILGCFCIFPGIPLITGFFIDSSIPLLPIDKTKCEVASIEQLNTLRDGFESGVEVGIPIYGVRSAYAVESRDFIGHFQEHKTYFVAAKIHIPGASEDVGPGVWFMIGPKNDPHICISLNDYAKEYSPWPDADKYRIGALWNPPDYDIRISMNYKEAKEVETCAK